MKFNKHTKKLHLLTLHTLLLLILFIANPVQAQPDPLGLLLTWQQDPATTMTLDWYTSADNENSDIEYRRVTENDEEHAWYLDRAGFERHFILTTIHGPHQHYLMINKDGQIIDEYPQTPHTDFSPVKITDPWLPLDENETVEAEEMDSE